MTETDYTHFFSNLNNIQVDRISRHRNQSTCDNQDEQNQEEIGKNHYRRHQLAFQLKKKLKFQSSVDHTIGDLIVDKYFTYELNRVYQKVTKMPKKFFVCGYCKEPFCRPSEYLKHCYIEDCPINHQRSTFFFHIKNSSTSFTSLTNKILQQVIEKKQFEKLLTLPYSQSSLILSRPQPLKNQKFSLSCQRCGYKSQTINLNIFINHYKINCSQVHKFKQLKQFKLVKNLQSLQDFRNDILNFHLNVNFFCMFDRSYLKILKLTKQREIFQQSLQQKRGLFNHYDFSDIFNDKNKSKIHMKFAVLPFYSSNLRFRGTIKPNICKAQKICQKMSQKRFDVKLNTQYETLIKYLQKTYFCGVCLNFFSLMQQYLAHCLIYLCPLNHQKNSHFFFEQKSAKYFNIQNLPLNKFQNDIQKIIHDSKFSNIETIEIQRKYTTPLSQGIHWRYKCGVCSKKYQSHNNYKNQFIHHVLKICQSQNHQLTTHYFKIKFPKVTDKGYEKFIVNHYYGIKIASCSFGYKFVLIKNDKNKFLEKYLCGSCKQEFQSKQEFVYHSIKACQFFQHSQSSHFIKKIYHPQATIQDPALNIVQEIDQAKKYNEIPQKNVQKQKTMLSRRNQKIQFENKPQQQIKVSIDVNSRLNSHKQTKLQTIDEEQKLQKTTQIQQNESFIKQQNNYENAKEQQSHQQNLNQPQTKFLRFNIDFVPSQDNQSKFLSQCLEFYCGKCQLNFKKDIKFVEHLQKQACKSYENLKSSHFYVTNNSMTKIMENKVFSNRKQLLQGNFHPQEFSIYQPIKSQRIICECKQSVRYDKLISHLASKHVSENSSKSHIILRPNYCGALKLTPIIMMAKNTGQINEGHEFVCPCKPWKKLSYENFVRHVLKRHNGRTPKFYMKLPKN